MKPGYGVNYCERMRSCEWVFLDFPQPKTLAVARLSVKRDSDVVWCTYVVLYMDLALLSMAGMLVVGVGKGRVMFEAFSHRYPKDY